MIIDVHTHSPRYRTRAEVGDAGDTPPWRPDKGVQLTQTWDD